MSSTGQAAGTDLGSLRPAFAPLRWAGSLRELLQESLRALAQQAWEGPGPGPLLKAPSDLLPSRA